MDTGFVQGVQPSLRSEVQLASKAMWKCANCGKPADMVYNIAGMVACRTGPCLEKLVRATRPTPILPKPSTVIIEEPEMPAPKSEPRPKVEVVDAQDVPLEEEEAAPQTQRDWESAAHETLAHMIEVRTCDCCKLCPTHQAAIDTHRRKE